MSASKRKSFFVLAALCLASLCLAKDISITCVPASEGENYAIEFDWHGMDAQKIERLVAVPLEEKLRAFENVVSVLTVCENSKCKTDVSFEKSERSACFEVFAAANELHKELPKEVQRPRIYAAASEAKRLFCAAFDAKKYSREEIESRLKGPLQSVPGAGKAVFSGGSWQEIQLAFDNALLCQRNAAPFDLAGILKQSAAAAFFGHDMAYRSRLESVSELNADRKIASLARARLRNKIMDSIVRVNGDECVLASLQSSTESQNMKIAAKARKILKKEFPKKDDYKIILDRGREQEKLLWTLAGSFFQSLAVLALIVTLVYTSAKKAAAVLLWTGVDLLFCLAAMAVLKIPLDSFSISGITISLGLLCDSALYLSDDCAASLSAMAISSLTTICAMLPLCALEKIAPGIRALALACALSIGISALLSLFFFNLFFERDGEDKSFFWARKARNFLNLYPFSYKTPRKVLNLSYFLYILPLLFFMILPKNLSSLDRSLAIWAQVEYEPEKSAAFVDRELENFCREAKKIEGVDFVQCESRRGSAEIQVALKGRRERALVQEKLLSLSGLLSGSLYLPLPAKKKAVQRLRVAALGDDFDICKKLSSQAASLVCADPFFARKNAQAALNFKGDERILFARSDVGRLAKLGMSVQDLSNLFRWNLFGAVAKKVFLGDRLVDVRVGSEGLTFSERADVLDLEAVRAAAESQKGGSWSVPLASLCTIESQKAPSKIYRKNGKSAAFWTLEVESDKSDQVFKEVKKCLKKMHLPQGYWFDFPLDYERMEWHYAQVLAAFFFSLLVIFVLVAAQCERPLDALKALATVPLSLFLPLALRLFFMTPLSLGDAAGMVFVSGLCVNNALYIMAEFNLKGRKDAAAACRAVSKSLFSSSATTIACSLPLLIFASGSFSADLAFFTLFGTLGSLAAATTFFPAMLEGKKNGPDKPGLFCKRRKNAARKRFNFGLSFRPPRFWGLSSSAKCPRQSPKQRRQGRS